MWFDEIISCKRHETKNECRWKNGKNVRLIVADPWIGLHHKISEESPKEKAKNKKSNMKSVSKIKFENFIHKKCEMARNICGEFLNSEKSNNIDQSCNERK